jgi:hypothetical protein
MELLFWTGVARFWYAVAPALPPATKLMACGPFA